MEDHIPMRGQCRSIRRFPTYRYINWHNYSSSSLIDLTLYSRAHISTAFHSISASTSTCPAILDRMPASSSGYVVAMLPHRYDSKRCRNDLEITAILAYLLFEIVDDGTLFRRGSPKRSFQFGHTIHKLHTCDIHV